MCRKQRIVRTNCMQLHFPLATDDESNFHHLRFLCLFYWKFCFCFDIFWKMTMATMLFLDIRTQKLQRERTINWVLKIWRNSNRHGVYWNGAYGYARIRSFVTWMLYNYAHSQSVNPVSQSFILQLMNGMLYDDDHHHHTAANEILISE